MIIAQFKHGFTFFSVDKLNVCGGLKCGTQPEHVEHKWDVRLVKTNLTVLFDCERDFMLNLHYTYLYYSGLKSMKLSMQLN